MTDLSNLDRDAKEYFYSLPTLFQAQIIESGVTFSSKAEFQKYYEAVSNNNENQQV